MKTRPKLLLTLAVGAVLVGAGVVHTTSFPKSGTPGVPATPTPERELLADALREHMRYQTIGVGQRQAARDGAAWALIDYISEYCSEAGLEPTTHEYKAENRIHQNVIAEKPGRRSEILLVGCHFDAYGRSPSADASASGTAAVIEVMRRVESLQTDRTIRFAFFSTGEPPYRGTEEMGSRQYAKACRERKDPIAEVLIIDSFGFYSTDAGSQKFWFPWNFAFPDTADFVAVVGDVGQRKHVARALAAWSQVSDMPARGLAITSWLARIRGGDQDAFTAEGFPAVLVTDTGVNRFEDIRTRFDTFDRIDYMAFARAVEGLSATVVELAGR